MDVYGGITRAVGAVLGLLAPEAAARYVRGREQLARVAGYGAARRDGPRGKWVPKDGNVNLRNARDRALLQARARQLVDDNPNLFGAIDKIIANVVYTGIKPQVRLMGRDGLPFKAANDAVEYDFSEWAEHQGWYELNEVALRHCWTDGGVLLHAYPRGDMLAEGMVPLGVELLELDALDSSVNGDMGNGNRAFYGIEVDRYGQPAAYHVREQNLFGGMPAGWFVAPSDISGSYLGGSSWGQTVRLPASSCRMITRQRRMGALLPVSWMASVINTIHDLEEYQDSERIAARLAAAFGVFVVLPPGDTGNDLSGNPLPALTGGANTLGRIIDGKEFISQGRIDALPHGADIKAFEHNRPGVTYEPFVKSTQRGASSAFSMSGEAFTNDYTDASFSSVRQAVLEERRGYRMQQEVLVRGMCAPLWRTWTLFRASFMRGDARIPVRWQRPGWSWVDPLKDANASRVRVEMGLISRTELCEEEGRDIEDVAAQLREESALLQGVVPALTPTQPQNPHAAPDKDGKANKDGKGDKEDKDSETETPRKSPSAKSEDDNDA